MTIIELPTVAKNGSVSVRPYIDPEQTNQGLEKYEMVIFDGVAHEEQVACIELNGIRRFLTGLNEYAPEVNLLPSEQKIAKIKEIRTVVAELEKQLAGNILEIEDPKFWNNVKLLRPDNDDFWNKISIRCSNQIVFLDPVTNPYDLIKVYAIEAGGFSIVAKSYENAKARAVPPKFYLDKAIETVGVKTEVKKLRNRALSELQKMYDKNANKLFYVCKAIDANSVQYKKSTPNDIMYDNMDKFITGEGVERNERRAAETFLAACALDIETLKIKALIKDSTYYKFIVPKSDGFIYHLESSSMMGRNVSDCIEYLKNALNDKILGDLLNKVEVYWNS